MTRRRTDRRPSPRDRDLPMNSANDALAAVLDPGRSANRRGELLVTLADELRDSVSVLALLEAAQAEPALELRRAFFEHALATDVTRIQDRPRFFAGLRHFAVVEDDAGLRGRALARLSPWGGEFAEVETLLVETLLHEFDSALQQVCLQGLQNLVRWQPATVQAVLDFVPRAPRMLRRMLADVLDRADAPSSQRGLVALLDPAESPEVRVHALEALSKQTRLEPATWTAIHNLICRETTEEFRAAMIMTLRQCSHADAEGLRVVFALLQRFPDRGDLLAALEHRLASFPELMPQLEDRFLAMRSARTRVRILELLQDAPALPLFLRALDDPHPQVRRTAVARCAGLHAAGSADVVRAGLKAATVECVASVREALAELVVARIGPDPEVHRGILDWLERESEPRIRRVLAHSLASMAPTAENLHAILRAARAILLDPATDAEMRRRMVGLLANVAFREAPELVDCLRTLLERSDSIEEVEALYDRLRELEPDAHAHAELLLSLFYRFAGEYPRDPLPQWLREFEALAPSDAVVRAHIPTIVRMTGATWISGAASSAEQQSMLLPGLMEQIRRGNWVESARLLREAWERRTIRKSDLRALFRKLLVTPGQEGLMQSAMVMMAKGGLTGPDILDLGFEYLDQHPRGGDYTHLVCDFLQGRDQDTTPRRSIDEVRIDLEPGRRADPHYRARLFEAFQQRGLDRFYRHRPEEKKRLPRPRDWSEWEYLLWPDKGIDWPVARLFFELKPYERIAQALAEPVNAAGSPARSVQYLLLLHLWQNPADRLPATVQDLLLCGLGALVRFGSDRTGTNLLRDRAVLVFRNLWMRGVHRNHDGEVAQDLRDLAADVYVALCDVSAGFKDKVERKFPSVRPEVLHGMNEMRVPLR